MAVSLLSICRVHLVKMVNPAPVKSRSRSSRCCGQPIAGRVGNKGVDINWEASPVSSPSTVLIHCGEVNKVKVNKGST